MEGTGARGRRAQQARSGEQYNRFKADLAVPRALPASLFASLLFRVRAMGKTAAAKPLAAKAVKTGTRKNMPNTPRMSADEKRLAREMHFDRDMTRTDVAEALGRDLSSQH